MKSHLLAAVATVLGAFSNAALAEKAAPLSALAKMPVKEITVFKDGHAFVQHSGKMPTDPAGNVVMDYLPAPVLGTFWPYSSEKSARLSAVTASQRKVQVTRTAVNLRELIEANIGAQVMVTEVPLAAAREAAPVAYAATILSLPSMSGEELEAIGPPNSGDRLPVKGDVVLLKTAEGVKVVNIDRIADVTFKGDHRPAVAQEEFRNLLTMKLEWAGGKAAKDVEVGLLYLQRGVRWIPYYKVSIDGKGNALVTLQASLINELTDLTDVTAHLVVGVPTFGFKEMVDPISLQQAVAQLSQYFREDAHTAQGFSNAIMSQSARMTEVRQAAPAGGTIGLGPEVTGSGKSEDLFIFTVKNITLRKGQRMTIPVAEYTLAYRDVYTLSLPFTPPPEVRQHLDSAQLAEISRLLAAPKVMHKIRLTNKGQYPLTTAPALILRGDRVLAQGMMTYTAIGADSDLDTTAAVDVRVKKEDVETKRTPNATNWQGNSYGRIDLAGKISLTNFGQQPIEVEIVRNVLGNVTEADSNGKVDMINVFEDSGGRGEWPHWWGWYSWPSWWHHFNGVGRVTWTVKLDAGKPATMSYTWHYYWR